MRPKVLLTYPVSPKRLEAMSSKFDCIAVSTVENRQAETLDLIDDIDALFCMGVQVNPTMIDKGKKLRIISNFGVGYDNIDVKYAQSKGIIVTNTPQSVTAPTANTAMALLLDVCRRISELDRKLRQNAIPNWNAPAFQSTAIGGKTLGIIGMGRIGKAMAKRALSFDLDIIYHNRNRLPEGVEATYSAKYCTLDELLQQADIVSLHMPLNKATHHLIGARELALMKEKSYLINTARGGVVDHTALIEALQNKSIAGAGLDVFENEPEIPAALLSLDNVVLTPHTGTSTPQARQDMFVEAYQQIQLFLSGKEPTARVV